ncbi:MAG: hypothetical protein ABIE07_14065 [Candidatus Zixiibacteriota bacterium]
MSDNNKDKGKDKYDDRPRPRWVPRYKGIIEIGVIIAACIIVYSSLDAVWDQLDLTNSQLEMTQSQLELSEAQLELSSKQLLYAEGPSLTIQPIKQLEDFKPYSGNLTQLDGSIIKANPEHSYTVFFTLENIGKSNATIDTIWYELLSAGHSYNEEISFGGSILFPHQPLVVSSSLKINKMLSYNHLRIVIKYRWGDSQYIITPLDRAYTFKWDFEKNVWRTAFTSPQEWDDAVAELEN